MQYVRRCVQCYCTLIENFVEKILAKAKVNNSAIVSWNVTKQYFISGCLYLYYDNAKDKPTYPWTTLTITRTLLSLYPLPGYDSPIVLHQPWQKRKSVRGSGWKSVSTQWWIYASPCTDILSQDHVPRDWHKHLLSKLYTNTNIKIWLSVWEPTRRDIGVNI